MTFLLEVPRVGESALSFDVASGQTVFMLGANGTGKSSLMHRFYSKYADSVRRISAHRQTWFHSSAITLSPQDKRTTETQIHSRDRQSDSRWKDDYSAQRASIAIYDLIDAENIRARAIAAAVDAQDIDRAKALSGEDAPIKVINDLLRLSNLPITISVKENEQVVASKAGSAPYSVAELSDGERNALLIAANVLTVKPGTLILIDEPERHLHRSIISPLLTLLFRQRRDCAFIVSTHDVTLPLDNPSARTLLVRDCQYSGSQAISWQSDLIAGDAPIDDWLKKEILGARRKLLFVEGTEHSLDMPLYSLIFPQVSIVPKESCRDVEHAVTSIRDASTLHWAAAWGIVDNDRRTVDDIARLSSKGIFSIPVYSVESIYYHPEIQQYIAKRHAVVTGQSADDLLRGAKTAAMDSIRPHAQRLAERAAEKALREQVMSLLPRRADVAAGKQISLTLDIPTVVAYEVSRLNRYLEQQDLLSLISHYPVRETPALSEIAGRLGFQGRNQYEGSVLKLLMDDESALAFVRSLFSGLTSVVGVA